MEVLGCGIVEQEILRKCGAGDKIGKFFQNFEKIENFFANILFFTIFLIIRLGIWTRS